MAAPVDENGKKLRGKARMQAKKQARQTGFTARARADFAAWALGETDETSETPSKAAE
jgi:hypothetical protein